MPTHHSTSQERSGIIDRVVLDEPGWPRREFPLHQRNLYLIGRSPDREIPVVNDEQVAPSHGVLHFDRQKTQWIYRDLADRTFRAQRPVTLVEVNAGDVLCLGSRTRLELVATRESSSSPVLSFQSIASSALAEATRRAANSAKSVVLIGPSGSGKTSVAIEIHEQSLKAPRSLVTGKFVLLNAGQLPVDQTRLADVLFGHVRGAFTGAERAKKGILDSVANGTLFFDEVESLSQVAQHFLLDILDTRDSNRTYERVGGEGEEAITVPRFRTIFASKVPLARSGLRHDLVNRMLDGMQIVVPSLQERQDDIATFVSFFCQQHHLAKGRSVRLDDEATRALGEYSWPGHVRELRSIVHVALEDAFERTTDELAPLVITGKDIRARLSARQHALGCPSSASPLPVVRPRRGPPTVEALTEVLARYAFNIKHTSDALSVSPTTIKNWLKHHSLSVATLKGKQ
jgi:DNA-binding NtrC family response regulator